MANYIPQYGVKQCAICGDIDTPYYEVDVEFMGFELMVYMCKGCILSYDPEAKFLGMRLICGILNQEDEE